MERHPNAVKMGGDVSEETITKSNVFSAAVNSAAGQRACIAPQMRTYQYKTAEPP